MGVLVIPQSLGYAVLAGLPPVVGLYASIVPTLVYAYIGASNTQAVGPVAITAIMTAASLSTTSPESYVSSAAALALLVGGILWLASLLRLGWITQFISQGVSAGFISAAAVLILFSQLKGLLGLPLSGSDLSQMATGFFHHEGDFFNPATATLGLISLMVLLMNRYRLSWLWGFLRAEHRLLTSRIFVLVWLGLATFITAQLQLDTPTVAALETSLPSRWQPPKLELLWQLLPDALLIALVAFVSTAAISDKLAKAENSPYAPSRELLGLGLANVASSLTGGFSVAGGLSRTGLNVALGAKTPLASVICAGVILVILLTAKDLLTGLPYAVLSAIIISSVFSMIDIDTLKTAYRHDKADMMAFLASFFGVCLFGLNIGLVMGLFASFAFLIYRSHQVHIAVVGQVGDSEHFRNIKRHQTTTFEGILLIRVDESLYFGNATLVHDKLLETTLAKHTPPITELVLIMTAVNHVDLTAQAMLSRLNTTLKKHGIRLHFSEIKGPVMDKLTGTAVMTELTGSLFLSTRQAVTALSQDRTRLCK